jgi:hypothetical protein
MAETVNGTLGVVWGIAMGMSGTGVTGSFATQSLQFSADADEAEIRNGKGAVVTDIFYNQRQTITIEVIPTGTTIALARTNNVLPAPGAIVTVTDTEDTELAGTNSGKYIFVRGSKSKSNTGATSLSMELKQYVENDVAVAVAAS